MIWAAALGWWLAAMFAALYFRSQVLLRKSWQREDSYRASGMELIKALKRQTDGLG